MEAISNDPNVLIMRHRPKPRTIRPELFLFLCYLSSLAMNVTGSRLVVQKSMPLVDAGQCAACSTGFEMVVFAVS